jgi:hypothetical protein
MTNLEYAAGLRQVAEFYETHPEMPLPPATICVYSWQKPDFLVSVKEMAKGGTIHKKVDADAECGYYRTIRHFGAVQLEASIPRRTICRLVTPAVYDCPDSLLEELEQS